MDYKSVVYNAARDGNLNRLKIYLHGNKGKEEVAMLVTAKTGGATPLVIACRNGHYDVAEYLIEKCNADIEQPGSVIFDGETIEGAPPLWCAAAAGHMAVVQLLVSRGARVNSTTRTNSTPLRAACFDGHYEIVRYLVQHGADIEVANRHGHTCLMIACYKGHYKIARYLLCLRAAVNRKSVKGNTALHDCAESGSLDILKLLLEHGAAMDVDSYGMTPLLAAAVTGHAHIVEHLVRLPRLVSRAERVDALELLGATYVDKRRDMVGALALWKRAMDERFRPGALPLPKPSPAPPVGAYEHAREARSPDDLDDLMADPDDMRMQALVIRERILGPAHPDTSYYIRYRGAVYADAGKFSRCIELWNYALDMQQAMLERLNPMTQSSLFSFTELFSFMIGEEGRPAARGRVVPPVQPAELLRVFVKAAREVELGAAQLSIVSSGASNSNNNNNNSNMERDHTFLTRVLVITLHLACLLARLIQHPACDEATIASVHRALYSLVRLRVRAKLGRSALHLACCRDAALVGRYPACQFPSAQLADLLLRVGAAPNARDDDGNTPLHLAAMARPCPAALARTLLEHGAHLDLVNKHGDTFQTLLRGQHIHELVNTAKYTRLACVAARTIRQFRIPYRGVVPTALEAFIQDH